MSFKKIVRMSNVSIFSRISFVANHHFEVCKHVLFKLMVVKIYECINDFLFTQLDL